MSKNKQPSLSTYTAFKTYDKVEFIQSTVSSLEKKLSALTEVLKEQQELMSILNKQIEELQGPTGKESDHKPDQ